MKKINLILGGGGANGLASVGVIIELLSHGYNIPYVTGTSAGAICGSLFAYYKEQSNDIDDIKNKLINVVHSDLAKFKDKNYLNLIKFYIGKLFGICDYHNFGMYKGEYMRKFLQQETKNMTFSKLTKTDLIITATEPTTGTLVVFSKSTTPNIKIADAACASSSIQGAFKPVGFPANEIQDAFFDDNSINKPLCATFNHHPLCNEIANNKIIYLQDGGNLGNTRMDIGLNMHKDNNAKLVGVSYTYDNQLNNIKQLNNILFQTISIMIKSSEKLILKFVNAKSKYNAIMIKPKTSVGTTQFKLSPKQKNELIQCGVDEIRTYLPL